MAAITICRDFGAQKIKSDTVSIVSPSISHEVMGPDAMILVFWMLSFKPFFSLSSFTFIKRLFSSSSLSALRVVSSATLGQVKKTLKIVTGTWVFLKANRSEHPSFWGDYIDKEPTSLVYKAFAYPGNFIFLINFYWSITAFLPQWLSGKESFCIVGDSGDVDLIPRLGRSPGGDLPTHYSCLKNLMDRGGWQATAQRVAKSWTQLSDWADKNICFIMWC